jgi:hypothetical protein
MDPRSAAVDDVHMPVQDGRVGTGWVAGVSALLAAVLLSAVGVAALRSDTASADTVLQRGADARIVLSDGTSRAAVEGERVPRGATVTAGRTRTVLATRDREVHLGGGSSVTVLDGVRQVLRSGFVMVDASDAPGLELQTPAATVTTDDDSLVRVDGGQLLRVGVLRGDAAAVRAAGRRATSEVGTYFQVQVPQGGLPAEPSPFVLTPGDAYERDLAADLVRADEDLTALASRLDADGSAGGAVMTALRTAVPSDPTAVAGAPGSEGTLGYLIATAAPGDDPVAARYAEVRELRTAGGSWGVVAALVEAEVARVGAALSALLDPGTVPVLAAGPLDVGTILDPTGGEATNPGGDPVAPGAPSGPQPAPRPTGGGDPGPTPVPTLPPGPADPVTEVVQDVVDTVLDLVPTPGPLLPPAVPPVVSVPVQVPLLVPTPIATLQVQLPPLLR